MLATLLSSSLLLMPVPQEPGSRPTSQPSEQPSSQPASRPMSDRDRMVGAEWAEDAPGQQVLQRNGQSFKFLPMSSPRYGSAEDVADRVRDEDLVIGLEVAGQAYAYPINMLGGPQREIVNDEHGNVAFCVNW